ncbi:MAG: hypothetical protein O8C59_01440 [Candidatus Methanoperedens sp.]|nr:hypothetical protein [Candidatus Methanoperedens sp.]MCZ7397158.1 hypothetical protein [Candidatus Methanoperedens sp.]
MIIDFILINIGILGLLILYAVLSHLSARMGEGMRVPKYYLLFYIAIIFLIVSIPLVYSTNYSREQGAEDTFFALLTLGNVIATVASYKYWWWLKYELWGKKGGKSDE